MYVHSFYRAGPVIGSAMSAIDQALWDIRGKALGVRREMTLTTAAFPVSTSATPSMTASGALAWIT
jgi:L-alanine-DL-glutamate epimerase-like enolase superfamily enzyme